MVSLSILFLAVFCLVLSLVEGTNRSGWNLPPKTTAVVTGGTKGIGKVGRHCTTTRHEL